MEFTEPDGSLELRRDTSMFKLAAEKPLKDLMLQEKSKELLECLVSDPGNTRLQEDLLSDIDILEADVAAAVRAELELMDDMERATAL